MAITFVPCKDKEHAIACREMVVNYRGRSFDGFAHLLIVG